MSALPSPASLSLSQRFSRAYDILGVAIADRAFPGCAFGVLAGDSVVLADALGRFTYEDGAPSVSVTTAYDLASVTKVVATTSACMLLHQRGKLDLDTPLGDLLPRFVVGRSSSERARHVRLRHLLAHNSGLPGYVEFFRTITTPDELVRACLELPLEAEPGTRSEYSDPGFILLGKALEVILNEELACWVTSEVFQPLRLTATTYAPSDAARGTIPPTEEDTWFRHRRIQGEVQDENAFVLRGNAGHAGVFSTVPDLLRYAQAILDAQRSGQKDALKSPAAAFPAPFFEADTIECFATRQGPEGSSRALGWDTPSENSSAGRHFSTRSIGHLGFSGCSLWIDLDARVAAVLLTNRTWPDRQNQAIRQVRPAFHDAIREAI